MNKETPIIAALACFLGVGMASLFMPKAEVAPQNVAMMISSSDHFAAPQGPSALEIMHKNAKDALADFARSDAAVKLASLLERNPSAADAAIHRSASACITERAGVELPKFQQIMVSEGVTQMVRTALVGGRAPSTGNDINAKAGAYMREHAAEVMEEMQNATIKQLTAGQTLMGEIASDPKLIMSCTAESAVQELALG